MISPDKMAYLAELVRELYVDLENQITNKIAQRLAKNIDAPNWLSIKLSEIQKLKQETEALISEFQKDSDKKVLEIITKVYNDGIASADKDFEALGLLESALIQNAPLLSITTNVNTISINKLVLETNNMLHSMNFQILRKTQDIYRDIISKTSASVIAGINTNRQAVQEALNEFANKGISGFVDKAGRNWELTAYADMATRTAIGRASMAGHEQRIQQLGEDLVLVSQHLNSCPLCDPWEGKVFSLSGKSQKYPPLSVAKENGLFHPNCGHVATLYVEGYTQIPDPIPKQQNKYDEKQKQRYLERQIRKWKRKEIVALNQQTKTIAKNKIKDLQSQIRQLVKQNDFRRKYEREKV